MDCECLAYRYGRTAEQDSHEEVGRGLTCGSSVSPPAILNRDSDEPILGPP